MTDMWDRDASPQALAVTVQEAHDATGVPVLGYIHWSLLDHFEWSSGYVPRFGMVAVDRTTFRRTLKPSLAAYRALIATTRARYRRA